MEKEIDNQNLKEKLRELSQNENLRIYFDSENNKIIKSPNDFLDYANYFNSDGTKKKNPYESEDWMLDDNLSSAFSDWNDRFIEIKLFLMDEKEFEKWALKLIDLKDKMSY